MSRQGLVAASASASRSTFSASTPRPSRPRRLPTSATSARYGPRALHPAPALCTAASMRQKVLPTPGAAQARLAVQRWARQALGESPAARCAASRRSANMRKCARNGSLARPREPCTEPYNDHDLMCILPPSRGSVDAAFPSSFVMVAEG